MKFSPALKSSLFVAILAGLFAFPFSGFNLIKYSPENEIYFNQSSAVLGVSTIPVRSQNSVGGLNIVHQEDLVLNLSDKISQKFYNVLPEDYVNGNYEIIVVVPNEVKESGLVAAISKSDLTYDLEVEIENASLQFQQVELSLLVIAR